MTETNIVAIVPIRFLPSTKNRLNQRLDMPKRQQLVQAMLSDVIGAIGKSELVSQFFIVTHDLDFLNSFSDPLFQIQRSAIQGLNEELTECVAKLSQTYTGHAIIILGDLPLLTGVILDELIWTGLQSNRPVIAKDWKGEGTNILFFRCPPGFNFQFGPDSFQRHMEEFQKKGFNPIVYHSMATALDIDDDAALHQLRMLAHQDKRVQQTRTFRLLFVDEKRGGKVV